LQELEYVVLIFFIGIRAGILVFYSTTKYKNNIWQRI